MNTQTEAPPADSIRLQHILVPFDFSDGARLALAHAIASARAFNARITLFHVVHLPYLGSGFGPGDGLALEARLVEETSSQLDVIAGEVKGQGVAANVVVRVGHPSSEVVEAARRDDIDLIVMGTHGRTGLKHVLLGSVAERVVRHAVSGDSGPHARLIRGEVSQRLAQFAATDGASLARNARHAPGRGGINKTSH